MPIFLMIRKYSEQDAQCVQEIALKCFDESIKGTKKLWLARYFVKSYFKEKNIESRVNREYDLFVLDDNKVMGFIEIEKGKIITNIFVDSDVQGMGYGRKLLDYAMMWCQSKNPDLLVVQLDAATHALGFYEHYGFKNLNRMKKTLGVETYTMEKKLKNN